MQALFNEKESTLSIGVLIDSIFHGTMKYFGMSPCEVEKLIKNDDFNPKGIEICDHMSVYDGGKIIDISVDAYVNAVLFSCRWMAEWGKNHPEKKA